jgi:hypothetical protein
VAQLVSPDLVKEAVTGWLRAVASMCSEHEPWPQLVRHVGAQRRLRLRVLQVHAFSVVSGLDVVTPVFDARCSRGCGMHCSS